VLVLVRECAAWIQSFKTTSTPRPVAHGSDHDYRLVALHSQVEEVGRFFHRVGTVRNHDAVYTRRRQQFIDALRDLQHDVKGHILRAHVGDLLSPEIGQILDSRDRIDHGVNRHLTRGIAGLRAGRGSSGNRSAGRQNDDVSLALAERILANSTAETLRDRFMTPSAARIRSRRALPTVANQSASDQVN
jgi:hypothetical protein